MRPRPHCKNGPALPVGAVAIILAILLSAWACASPDTGPTIGQRPLTTRWPPGVSAVVLGVQGRSGFFVTGPAGVIFEELRSYPGTKSTTTIDDGKVRPPQYSMVTSADGKLVAYAFAGEALVVSSVADGSVLYKADFSLSVNNMLRAVSNDGRFVALAPTSARAIGEPRGDPWTLAVFDLVEGERKVAAPLASLVEARIARGSDCGLIGTWWLPENRLLVNLSGDMYETYVYDPAIDTLQLVPDLDYVLGVSAEGTAFGRGIVWHQGSEERVVFDESWPVPIDGRISANGKVLAFLLAKEETGEPPGSRAWQVFTRTGSDWFPAGPALHRGWMNVTNRSEWGTSPWVVSGDGRMAWTLLEGSSSLPDLVSIDLASGESQKWFTAENLRVDPDLLGFVTLVPSN